MPETLPATLEFSLTAEDLEAYYRLHEYASRKAGYSSNLSFAYAPAVLGAAILVLAGIGDFTSGQFGGALVIGFISYLVGVLAYRHEVMANYSLGLRKVLDNPTALGRRTLAVAGDRLEYGGDEAHSSISLALIDTIEIIGPAVCIWLKGASPIAVPLRAFASRAQAEAFCADLKARSGGKPATAAST